MQNYEVAFKHHEEVLRLSLQLEDKAIEAKAYGGLGIAARQLGNLLQAKKFHEKQLETSLKLKDKSLEGMFCQKFHSFTQIITF